MKLNIHYQNLLIFTDSPDYKLITRGLKYTIDKKDWINYIEIFER
jgi:hypothetical protein